MRRRKSTHFSDLRNQQHPNWMLQRAYNRNPNFHFIPVPTENREIARYVEQDVINTLEGTPGFLNISRSVATPMLGRTHTPEARAKISAASKGHQHSVGRKMSDEVKALISTKAAERWSDPAARLAQSQRLTGREVSDETREKLRRASLGHPVSAEAREKIAAFNRGKIESPETIEKKRDCQPSMKSVVIDGVPYRSINEAARAHGISSEGAAKRFRSTTQQFSGWTFVDKD